MENFILEFKDALDHDFCQHLVNKFDASAEKQAGRTGGGVDKLKKDSTDLYLSELESWRTERQRVEQTVMNAAVQYTRMFPFLLTGAVAPAVFDPQTQQTISISFEDIQNLRNDQIEKLLGTVYRHDNISLQRYTKGSGGYHHWHSENFPHPGDAGQKALHRVLLWLLYLNDVEDGGETDFYFQKVSVKPKRGSLILAPCGFTHTHRGSVPQSDDKYVLASWIMYQPAEILYGENK